MIVKLSQSQSGTNQSPTGFGVKRREGIHTEDMVIANSYRGMICNAEIQFEERSRLSHHFGIQEYAL